MLLEDFIKYSLEEDIGTGDVTTLSVIPADRTATGKFIAKEKGVICGLDVARKVFECVDGSVSFEPLVSDGDEVENRQTIATVSGNARSLLIAERTALNILQRLSGVATRTKAACEAVKGTKASVCDTRKTTPLMRSLEKYAVRCGGGSNHRFNLADGVLIKDNHIAAAGSITEAVQSARKNAPHTLKIEVEVENFDMLREAIDAGADIIMLDNMSYEDMAEAVRITAGRAILEASGNMGERDLRRVASCGVDLISVGALTHSPKALDISLKFSIEGA